MGMMKFTARRISEEPLKRFSPEWKKKISDTLKAKKIHPPEKYWFKNGETSWNKGLPPVMGMLGKKHSEETKLKISQVLKEKGIKPTYSFPKGHSPWNKGIKGIHLSPTTELKMGDTGELSPRWRGGFPKCSICGGRTRTYKTDTCRKCYLESVRKNRQEDYFQRKIFYRKIRECVLERDNYMCQICGSKDNLQVDHIQQWAENVELRFSIDNCRTLCMGCHYKITFGREIPVGIVWGSNYAPI